MGNWGLSVLDKLNISEEILANPNNKALLKQYYDDYVDGLENISEALAEYRRLLMGGKKVASEKINDSPEEFDIEKVMKLVENLKQGKYNPLNKTTKKVKIEDIDDISSYDKEYLRHELNNNLTEKERKRKIVQRPVGDYIFKIKNNGFDDYEYIERKSIDDIINN